jgi:hypothetical protein
MVPNSSLKISGSESQDFQRTLAKKPLCRLCWYTPADSGEDTAFPKEKILPGEGVAQKKSPRI